MCVSTAVMYAVKRDPGQIGLMAIHMLSHRQTIYLQVHILDMDIEYADGCIYDQLILHDGSIPSEAAPEVLCGTSDSTDWRITNTSDLYITFDADAFFVGYGFLLTMQGDEILLFDRRFIEI